MMDKNKGKVITGYCAKEEWKDFLKGPKFHPEYEIDEVPRLFKRRDRSDFWGDWNWPPVKVRVTVEVVTGESDDA